jgi:hypothetical protein
MAAVMEQTTRHRDGWLGAEFDRGALYWDFTPAHLAAIDELMATLAGDPRPFHEITRADFSHPSLDADLAELLATIKTGPGLVVVRGFPVDKYTPADMQTLYWGIGAHFGHGCSQSADGDYLGHVTNVEKASRGYTTARELSLHTDSAEIVGLLCVRDAKEGGMSIYASSLKVHEIVARERPEYLAVLERGFRCDRRGEEAPEDEAVTPYRVPVFSEQDGVLSTRFVRGVIDRGADTLGEPLSELEKDALAFFEAAAQRDEVRLELTLRPARPRSSTITRCCTRAPPSSTTTTRPENACSTACGSKANRRGRCARRFTSTRTVPAVWASTRSREEGRGRTQRPSSRELGEPRLSLECEPYYPGPMNTDGTRLAKACVHGFRVHRFAMPRNDKGDQTGSSFRRGSGGNSTSIRSPGLISPGTRTTPMIPALRIRLPSASRSSVAFIKPG